MVGIALGGLGVLSLRLPRDVSFQQLVDLPTLLLAIFLVAILSLIAYFTNPSEASFRAFLTELAFRQHISRLSELQEGDPEDDDDDTRLARPIDYKGPRKKPVAVHARTPHQYDSPIVFHFANKASVSLRTPGYRFRSLAVLTFAVVSPAELTVVGGQSSRPPSSPSTPSQRGACFIGAFGHWWLALEMRMLSRHVRLAAHDDPTASTPTSEISVTRPPDDHREHHSPPKPPRPHIHRAPPRTKAALRERLSLHTPGGPPRPTTPPPLPKSASLPLHGPPPAPSLLSQSPVPAVPTPAPSPILSEILAQIDAARAATSDFHAQLAAYRAPVPPAHAALHAAVEAARETKKREDASRAAVKARTKTLEDARRQADARKREAEKRLKAAAVARDSTTDRIERLEHDIGALRARMVDDEARVKKSREDSREERTRLESELEAKREEVGAVEEAMGRLAARARELEETVATEKKRLEMLKAARTRDTTDNDRASVWPPPIRPPALALGGISNQTHNYAATGGTLDSFSPFSDSPSKMTGPLSPVSAGLLPSSLVQSMDSPREAFFARTHEDRSQWFGPSPQHLQKVSVVVPPEPGLNPAAKVFTFPSQHQRRRLAHDPSDTAAASFPITSSASFSSTPGTPFATAAAAPGTAFSTSGAPFGNDATAPAVASPAPTDIAALHSAFAPSPAEREALQRALDEGNGSGSGHSSPPMPGRSSVVQPRSAGFFNPWVAKE